MYIIKRNGEKVLYDKEKIIIAISKANDDLEKDEDKLSYSEIEDLSNKVEKNITENITVENIQDLVEQEIVNANKYYLAKSYIIYRNNKCKEREQNNSIIKNVQKIINGDNKENANANVDEKSFSGMEKEACSSIFKDIALNCRGLSKISSDAHKLMKVYGHDLEKAIIGEHNCANVNFQRVFERGFKTRNGYVRPPSTISTACQLVAVVFQCQSQVQFGGVGTIHIDTDLAPFVAKSFKKHFIKNIIKSSDDFINLKLMELSKKEFDEYSENNKNKYLSENNINEDSIYIDNKDNLDPKFYAQSLFDLIVEGRQSAEALYHNLNTLESRQGSQVPFTSINYGRDTSTEGRLIIKWMLEASINGIGPLHTTSIFPISIFQYKSGVNANKGDVNYDLKQLALDSLSKRIYPNWANCDWSLANETEGDPDTYFSTMGCRTLVGYDRHGLGYKRQGRGNCVPVTMILPRIGIEYGICRNERENPDIEGFWNEFEDTLKIAEHALLERFEIMISKHPSCAPFMYENGTMEDTDKCIDNVYNTLKHCTLAIGYIGIAETCQAMFGDNHVNSTEAYEFALSVVKRINEFASEASERNDLNFSCYATPAEGLCRTALISLRKQYGVIENVTSREYLTNSHHVPVWEKVSIWQKLDLEAPFCKYPTGGCITYIELDSTFMNNHKAIEDIIDYAFKVKDIPYLAFNFPMDICMKCGYQGEFDIKCPQCGEEEDIVSLRRVTGYLTLDKSQFNDGKKAEEKDRVKHSEYTNLTCNLYLGD